MCGFPLRMHPHVNLYLIIIVAHTHAQIREGLGQSKILIDDDSQTQYFHINSEFTFQSNLSKVWSPCRIDHQ